MKNIFLILLPLLLALSSCRQYEELVYFNELGNQQIVNTAAEEQLEYRIRVNDILYVKVLSTDERINAIFNAATEGGTTRSVYFSDDVMYFTGYSVRNDGAVDIPMLGLISVKGKTIEEAKSLIQERASHQINDAIVLAKLADFKVTLLGEVSRPGMYNYYNNQTTILEALAKAGDLTDYGNRNQVLVIRPTIQGSETYRIDLQDLNLLTSPQYFIQPNDVIYVPPLKAKGIRLMAQDYGILITTLSSTLTAVSLVLTIILNVL